MFDGSNFTYGTKSSEEFGVILVKFDAANIDSVDESTNIITTKNVKSRKFDLHGVIMESPLTFEITISKANGDYFDTLEEERIKKWLCKNSWDFLTVDKSDMMDKTYCCILNNPKRIKIAENIAGLSFSVTCNSNVAWSKLHKLSYTSKDTLLFRFHYNSKFQNESLHPILIIKPTSDGNISIKNNTTNKTLTLNNCINGETVIFDGENETFESNNGRNILGNWNETFISMVDGNNDIALTGKFNLTIEYRLPVRIGG